MQKEEILTTIASTRPDTCLEVAVYKDSAGEPGIELRRLSWGEGIGWYRQQTLRLDAAEAAGLLHTLRGQWRDRSSRPVGKVVPFPLLTRTKRPERKTA